MSNANRSAGLCATCKHDPGCIYEANSNGMVLQCEQFEMDFPEEPARPVVGYRSALPKEEMDTNGYVGLCASCDNRKTCIYLKPEGGVWRCEEYA
jgi:hypothetical protein